MNKNYVLLIPVYNESQRISKEFYKALALLQFQEIIFVDDGSSDNSRDAIDAILGNRKDITWLVNSKNMGKAESVRRAMIESLSKSQAVMITTDADGAVDAEDIARIINIHKSKKNFNSIILSGARVKLAGSEIARTPMRHWIGRLVATMVNILTSVDIYDPQSPLKVYDIDHQLLSNALKEKFKTKWFFEMELILRLEKGTNHAINRVKIIEHPISKFTEVPLSNLKKRHIFLVVKEILILWAINKSNQ